MKMDLLWNMEWFDTMYFHFMTYNALLYETKPFVMGNMIASNTVELLF